MLTNWVTNQPIGTTFDPSMVEEVVNSLITTGEGMTAAQIGDRFEQYL